MRDYSHKIDVELLVETIEFTQETIEEIAGDSAEAKADRNEAFFALLGELNLAMASYHYAEGKVPLTDVKKQLHQASLDYAKAVKFGLSFDPYDYLTVLALGVVAGDDKATVTLADFERARYTDDDVEVDELMFDLAAAFAAHARNDEVLLAEMFSNRPTKSIDPKSVYRYDRMMFLPILQQLEAIAVNDSSGYQDALAARTAGFQRFVADDDVALQPASLLDILGLAVDRFAIGKDFETPGDIFRPADMLV